MIISFCFFLIYQCMDNHRGDIKGTSEKASIKIISIRSAHFLLLLSGTQFRIYLKVAFWQPLDIEA